jgi:hypothetical protein
MAKTRNRLNHWRHELHFDKQKDFAKVCGLSENLYNRYVNHHDEPGRDQLWLIWNNLKKLKLDIHIEDLIEETPE